MGQALNQVFSPTGTVPPLGRRAPYSRNSRRWEAEGVWGLGFRGNVLKVLYDTKKGGMFIILNPNVLKVL